MSDPIIVSNRIYNQINYFLPQNEQKKKETDGHTLPLQLLLNEETSFTFSGGLEYGLIAASQRDNCSNLPPFR